MARRAPMLPVARMPLISYVFVVILGFADAFSQDLFDGKRNARTRGFPASLLAAAYRKLDMLGSAHVLASPPGDKLEALKGDLKGFHSIRINQQWRIVFRWTGAGPSDVKITDYH